MARCLSVLLVLLLTHAETAQAETYYVRSTGNDSNAGLSPDTAFATITRAAKQAAGTGNLIVVGPGLYREGDIKPAGGGVRTDPSVFLADRRGDFTGDTPGEVIIDASDNDNGFRLQRRSWVIVNGFTVMNAREDGIFLKNLSDNGVIANCIVHSNRGRGIRVRDSAEVVVFNNLVYANGGTGIEFEGEGERKRPLEGSPRGVIMNNTVYGNGGDGVRIEDEFPSEDMTVVNNIVAENQRIGINLKEGSSEGFVGQWNLVFRNAVKGYNTRKSARGSLDLSGGPLLVQPAGSDCTLAGSGCAEDDFRLAQGSPAVDASPVKAKKLGLSSASALIDGGRDTGAVDLGFHSGNVGNPVLKLWKNKRNRPLWKTRKSFARDLRKIRRLDKKCEKKVEKAKEKLKEGRGPCLRPRRLAKLARACGSRSALDGICR